MLLGAGYAVIGVTVGGPAPLGRIQLELNPGVTVLYGRNGSGKSRTLAAIAEAVDGLHAEHPGLTNRELLIQLDEQGRTATARQEGWLRYAYWALTKALSSQAQSRFQSSGGDFEAGEVIENPPESLGELIAAVTDMRLWLADRTLHTRVAEDGYMAIKAMRDGFVASPAVTLDALVDSDQEDVLWDSVRFAVYVTAQILGMKGIPLQGTPRLDDMSLWVDRALDPSTINDLERGEFLTSENRESWNAYSLGASGPLQGSPVRLAGWGPDAGTIRSRTLAAIRLGGQRVIDAVAEDDVALTPDAQAASGALVTRTNHMFSLTLLDAPELRLRIGVPDEWLDGTAPAWEALDAMSGTWVPLADLSSAQRRWAVLAIELALAESTEPGRPIVVLLDEPEAALHRSAEAHLVTGLKRLALELGDAAVIVATHSPAFLADGGVRPIHVHRSLRGLAVTSEIDVGLNDSADQIATMASLGLRRADLLQLARVAVVVEGGHDEAVIETVAAAEIAESRAFMLRMLGAKNAVAVLDAQVLISMTDATVLVVLDNDAHGRLYPMWERLRAHADSGDVEAADKEVNAIRLIGTGESSWLAELAERSLRIGRLDRLHVFGLSEPDVLFYLPPEAFKLTDPWLDLHREWRALPRGRADFKTWLRSEKGASISTPRAKRAATALQDVPPDLAELADCIRRLSLHSTDPR